MIDLDDDFDDYEDDDWGDPADDYDTVWDEPACTACNDTGSRGYRPCPDCRPGPIRRLWWRLTDPIRGRLHGRRARRHAEQLADDPWAPMPGSRRKTYDPSEPPF